jgi:hypothetical protein
MRENIERDLHTYKGNADYGYLYRRIESLFKNTFSNIRTKSEKNIADTQAVINQILAEEHVQENSHVYGAE